MDALTKVITTSKKSFTMANLKPGTWRQKSSKQTLSTGLGCKQHCKKKSYICLYTKRYLHIYTFAKLTIMCFVGIAMAIGQIFDIPIVLCSLAMSLSSNCRVKLPIPFDLRFMAMLEVGTNGNQMDRVVDFYAHDWWNDHTRMTVPKFQNMFTTETVDECLAHH